MTPPLVQYKDYTAGWLDSSVHDFLATNPLDVASIQFALITCLDSDRNLSRLLKSSPQLKNLASDAEELGTGLLLPTKKLCEAESAASTRVLFGFDEVWFFPQQPQHPGPVDAGLVGPNRIHQTKMNALGKWMEANSCTLALGDGAGLNFILQSSGVVKYLVGNSIQQPVRSFDPVTVASPQFSD